MENSNGPPPWVRNHIYLAALTVVLLFVIAYEEPRLRHRFGEPYRQYLRTTPRWLPHRPPS